MARQTIVIPAEGRWNSLTNIANGFASQGYSQKKTGHRDSKLVDYSIVHVVYPVHIPKIGLFYESLATFKLYTYSYPEYVVKKTYSKKEVSKKDGSYYDDTLEEKLGGSDEKLGV